MLVRLVDMVVDLQKVQLKDGYSRVDCTWEDSKLWDKLRESIA